MMEVMTLDLVRSLSFFLSCWRIPEIPTTLIIQENGLGELTCSSAKCICTCTSISLDPAWAFLAGQALQFIARRSGWSNQMFRKRQVRNLIRSRFIQMQQRLAKTRNGKSTIPAWHFTSTWKDSNLLTSLPPWVVRVFGNRPLLVLWRQDTTWVHARSMVSALNLVSALSDQSSARSW